MPISMSPSAHYVTQSRIWGGFILGPLSDRRIKYYTNAGYYGASKIRQEVKRKKRHINTDKLFTKFI